MEKFDNYHHPERHYTHYSDRKAGSLRYTLRYRGYDLEVSRDISVWQVGIYPTQADLPILRRGEVYSQNPDDAVIEAKRRVDAVLR